MNKTALSFVIIAAVAFSLVVWKLNPRNLSADLSQIATSTSLASTTLEVSTGTAATGTVSENSTTTTSVQATEHTSIEVSNQSIYQGDTIFLTFKNGTPSAADFNGSPMHIFEFGGEEHAIYPVSDIFTPGNYVITAKFQDGETISKSIQVLKFQFPTYQMGQPGGTPTPEVQAELTAQAAEFNSTFEVPDTLPDFVKTFVPPLHTALKITSAYGEVREYIGGGAARHLGVDFAAPIGTPVYAINGGVVVKVRNYLSYGNTIIIDHGAGIFSMYLHLSKIEVREGQKVSRDQEIGLSGDTGYETGPHLHLSLKIGGVSVDPMKFINTINSSE